MSRNASRALRSATLTDLEVVASWIGSARECELWAGWRLRFPIDRASLAATIGFSPANAFTLVDGEEVVAFGQLIPRASGRAHLARIVVSPDRRRAGCGTALVRALVSRARGDWFRRVSLNVDEANQPAISLYASLGFQDVQRPPDEPESPRSRYMECQT